jgi:hypothetical protein
MRPRRNGRGNPAEAISEIKHWFRFNEAPAQWRGNGTSEIPREYRGLQTNSRGVPRPWSGVPDACSLGVGRRGRNPFVHNVKYHASAWRATDGARPLAARRRVTLHDHRAAFDHGEGFAEAFDARANALGGAEVEDHDMVLRVVDDLA